MDCCKNGDWPHITQTCFRRLSCKLERRQHVFRQRSHLILPVYCSPNIIDAHSPQGVQMFRCTSEIRQRTLQQRLSLDVPARFNPPKAKTVVRHWETCHASHRHASLEARLLRWSGGNTCLARDLTLFFLCSAHRT